MKTNRVVITGIGAISAFGRDWHNVQAAFAAQKNAVRAMPEYDEFVELEAKLAAPIPDYTTPAHWTRKQLRSMGLVSQYCVDAAEQALVQA
ncbi:beta-ketoacyl synthase N-terminal-like domain-containing protein, partial [Kingella kingae]